MVIIRKADRRAYLSWMEARYSAAWQSLAVLFLSLHAAAAYSNPAYESESLHKLSGKKLCLPPSLLCAGRFFFKSRSTFAPLFPFAFLRTSAQGVAGARCDFLTRLYYFIF